MRIAMDCVQIAVQLRRQLLGAVGAVMFAGSGARAQMTGVVARYIRKQVVHFQQRREFLDRAANGGRRPSRFRGGVRERLHLGRPARGQSHHQSCCGRAQ